MKKVLCVILTVLLFTASSAAYGAVEYTLPEKMQKQLDIGSGLKGNITLHAEGSDALVFAFQPFQDVELQIRGIKSGEESHYYIYQEGENEAQNGLTEFYNDGNRLFLRSDLLPNDVFSVPQINELTDILTAPEGGNPPAASMVLRWLQLDASERDSLKSSVTDMLNSELEKWSAAYVSLSPVRTLDSGASVFDMNYAIPMADLKEEIVRLLVQFVQSDAGKAFTDKIMNAEQKEIFANPNLDYFYADALSALNNDYDLIYTKTVSTLGDAISSSMELPLDEEKTKYQALLIEENGGLVSYTLRGDEQQVTLLIGSDPDLSQIDGASAWIMVRPSPNAETAENGVYRAIRAEINHSSQVSTDEDARDHLHESWTFQTVRDVSRLPKSENPENYPEESPIRIQTDLHYYSKYSQSSPTTLEFSIEASGENFVLRASGQLKTASPWVFSPFSTENATDLTSLSGETLSLKLAEYLASAAENLTPAEEQGEEASASEEDAQEGENSSAAAESGEPSASEAEEQENDDASEEEKNAEEENPASEQGSDNE